ncbi:MAG: hybrid sensor histidine kinase/response regulator [Candidatus Delongbacteria bacterium]
MYNISLGSNSTRDRATVLIVDDEPLIVQSLNMVLERYFTVISETDPLKVTDILLNRRVDVLISDEMMPGMKGCALAEKVNNEFPNICKIILSGNSDKKDIVNAINRGHIFSFLFKPVDINQLLQVIKRGLDHKRMKETIESQNKDLEEKNKNLASEIMTKTSKIVQMEKFYELGKFSASIVHDLKTPLQTLITGYEMMENEVARLYPEDNSMKKILSIIDSSLISMEDMIKGISNRINHKITENTVYFDLNELIIKNIDRMYMNYKKQYPFEIKFEPEKDIPKLKGVTLHFEQILSNILKNAYDAIKKAGSNNIMIKTATRSNKLCVFIKDNGIGISEEDLDRIFDVGFSTKRDGKGTGLGLVITKQMVESYKGKIRVESKPGEGTSFLICFPVKNK